MALLDRNNIGNNKTEITADTVITGTSTLPLHTKGATNSVVQSSGQAGYGSFKGTGSGTNQAYLFLTNSTTGELCRVTGGNAKHLNLSTDGGVTNNLNINSTGDVTLSDTLFLTNGNINFPDTANVSADANTLDDYEEGTWDPQVSDATPNNATQSLDLGRYQKCGNQVTLLCRVTCTDVTATAGLSGDLRISGFPYAAATEANFMGAVNFGYLAGMDTTAGTEGWNISGYVPSNGAIAILRIHDAVGGTTALAAADVADTFQFSAIMTYRATV